MQSKKPPLPGQVLTPPPRGATGNVVPFSAVKNNIFFAYYRIKFQLKMKMKMMIREGVL